MTSDNVFSDLPKHCASMSQYSKLSNDGKLFAIYIFESFSTDELGEIAQVLSASGLSPTDPTLAKLAPEYDCPGLSLQIALQRHATLAAKEHDQQQCQSAKKPHHPSTLLAIASKHWKQKGILAVNMNTDHNGTIEVLRLPAKGSAVTLANIEIGNSSWDEPSAMSVKSCRRRDFRLPHPPLRSRSLQKMSSRGSKSMTPQCTMH